MKALFKESLLGLLAGVVLAGTGINARAAGGTVNFANNSSSKVINSQTGNPATTNDTVQAALYWTPAGAMTFTQVGATVRVGVPLAGLFAGGTRSTNSIAGGVTNQFQVRAWGGGYTNFEEALLHPGVLIGQSAVVQVNTGDPGAGPPTPPNSLVGLAGFTLTNLAASVQPPSIICNTNKIVGCADAWAFDVPTATDGCTGASLPVWLVSTQTNFMGCSNVMIWTWAATNSCNSLYSTCGQTVTVLFNQRPVFNCPADQTVSCTNALSFIVPTAYDPCSGNNLAVSPLSTVTNFFGCSNVVVQTWTAANTCYGVSAQCSQAITILFDQPPVFNCSTNKAVSCTNVWAFVVPTAYDPCNGNNLEVSPLSTVTNIFGCSNVVVQTWTATNTCSGVSAQCSQAITILFDQPPAFNCAADKTVACTNVWTFDVPTAYDPCNGSNLVVNPFSTVTNSFGCSNVVVQTWTATNICNGISAQCSQSVTVIGVPPTIVCPTNIVVTTCDTNVVVSWTLAATGACGSVTAYSVPQSGTAFLPNTTNTILCTANDGCGNTNTCTFTVTVLRPTLGAISILRGGGSVTLQWTDGILQQATDIRGPWADVTGAQPPSFTVIPTNQEFFRLRCGSP